jgi:hypothetical protein
VGGTTHSDLAVIASIMVTQGPVVFTQEIPARYGAVSGIRSAYCWQVSKAFERRWTNRARLKIGSSLLIFYVADGVDLKSPFVNFRLNIINMELREWEGRKNANRDCVCGILHWMTNV